ncbi:MAG: hypothetical protein NTX32_00130 [Candidatus Firestonebacteria bacterium]|nr:hypothetical protein [Candidatus Firestonebacteria bacterium]
MKEFLKLLSIDWKTFRNRARHKEKGSATKKLVLSSVSLIFLVSVFSVFFSVLRYFNTIPLFGNILVWKLLGMVFISFLFMLLFSNVIVSISTFYLSDDMVQLLSSPISVPAIVASRFVHAVINSSWMVFAMGIPIFASYSAVMNGGLLTFAFSMSVLFLLLLLAGSVSISFAMGMMRVFPAKKTRDFFIILSIVGLSFIVIMFRLIKPERFTDPHELAGFTEFMASFETPDAPYLPSGWAANAITSFFKKKYEPAFLNLLYLFVSSAAGITIMLYLGKIAFLKGWWNTAENQLKKYRRNKIEAYDMRKAFSFVTSNIVEVAIKDIKNFTRDTSQWPQLFMLISVIIIYLFNVTNLPLDRLPKNIYAKYVNDIIFFLNMGFAGFIIAAVAARFVYSSVSLEGRAFWIIKTSPFSLKKYIWEKYWLAFFPLLFLSELLISLSIYFLKIDLFMSLVSVVMVFFFSLCISSLGIGIGAIYPNFKVDNTSDIAASYGGIIYMICSMIYIGISLMLIAIPVKFYYAQKITGVAGFSSNIMLLTIIIFTAVQIVVLIAPMYLGEKALRDIEF